MSKNINFEHKLQKILPGLKMPGRYTGGELNQVKKDWDKVLVRTALLFPEIYDLGMSNLAITVLYDLINRHPDFLAERVFVPWVDMEAALRNEGIPLFSLENKKALHEFDLIAVSLPYESLYTNFLNALDLGKIPVFSRDRQENHPIVLAGGHATYNPEPVAPFLDAVAIGEGEEIILEIHQVLLDSAGSSRSEILKRLSFIPGIYVPAYYQASFTSEGIFSALDRLEPDAPEVIQKRIVGRLPPPPVKPVVPYIDIVHNRAALEIMRGCTRGCRFCQAGMVTRPVRERPVEEIIQAMQDLLPSTGYSEVGLLSLSSSDYTNIIELIEAINETFDGENLAVSLPSLRIESVSVSLMDALSGKRRSGFTLAPEAATERLRQIINKPISDQQLLDTSRQIFQHGWHTIKLYFMIGHPEETLEDVQAIAQLSRKVLDIGRSEIGGRAKVNASVSSFVPKPHTPFQWMGMNTREITDQKLDLLRQELRGKGLKLNWNDPRETHFEAWLSRGDRRVAEVIYQAWKSGARFDAWQEHFNFQVWLDAFQACGLNPEQYTTRPRDPEEALPWDHINSGVRKKFLLEEFRLSRQGKTRPDCRGECYACGILPMFNDVRQDHSGELWFCPEGSSTSQVAET